MFNHEKEQTKSVAANCIECLKTAAETLSAGINFKSNGIANDQFFADVERILPEDNLDLENTIMYHLKSHLDSAMEIAGERDLDLGMLTYRNIVDYFRRHQDKLADSTHTYRVILDLLNMAFPKPKKSDNHSR